MQFGAHQMVSEPVIFPCADQISRSTNRSVFSDRFPGSFPAASMDLEDCDATLVDQLIFFSAAPSELDEDDVSPEEDQLLDVRVQQLATEIALMDQHNVEIIYQLKMLSQQITAVDGAPYKKMNSNDSQQEVVRSESFVNSFSLNHHQISYLQGYITSEVRFDRDLHHQKILRSEEADELMWDIYFLEDKGNFDEYLRKFVKLAFPIERFEVLRCNEEFILNLLLEYFVGGLREEFKLYVSSLKSATLLEAMNLAAYYEKVEKHGEINEAIRSEFPISHTSLNPHQTSDLPSRIAPPNIQIPTAKFRSRSKFVMSSNGTKSSRSKDQNRAVTKQYWRQYIRESLEDESSFEEMQEDENDEDRKFDVAEEDEDEETITEFSFIKKQQAEVINQFKSISLRLATLSGDVLPPPNLELSDLHHAAARKGNMITQAAASRSTNEGFQSNEHDLNLRNMNQHREAREVGRNLSLRHLKRK